MELIQKINWFSYFFSSIFLVLKTPQCEIDPKTTYMNKAKLASYLPNRPCEWFTIFYKCTLLKDFFIRSSTMYTDKLHTIVLVNVSSFKKFLMIFDGLWDMFSQTWHVVRVNFFVENLMLLKPYHIYHLVYFKRKETFCVNLFFN